MHRGRCTAFRLQQISDSTNIFTGSRGFRSNESQLYFHDPSGSYQQQQTLTTLTKLERQSRHGSLLLVNLYFFSTIHVTAKTNR